MFIDIKNDKILGYKVFSQVIVPRPIAWVVSGEDNINIAPFSFFMGVSTEPPVVMISVGGTKEDGSVKDTLVNISKFKQCTICSTPANSQVEVDNSAQSLAYDESEASKFGIKTEIKKDGFPPIISISDSAFFCTLSEIIDKGAYQMVLLNVEGVYVNDSCVTDKERVTIELDPLARIGRSYKKLV